MNIPLKKEDYIEIFEKNIEKVKKDFLNTLEKLEKEPLVLEETTIKNIHDIARMEIEASFKNYDKKGFRHHASATLDKTVRKIK